MKPKCLIVILLLLTAAGSAQLTPDKERFDVVLHPGEMEERTLVLTNTGDTPIYEISKTEISGSAADFIFLKMPDNMPLMPKDEAEIKIYFALTPETKPGSYSGYIYLLDRSPPSLPIRIDFDILAIAQESYGISMTIDDAKSGTISASAKDIAQFELAVKNLGSFRDVALIDCGPLPEGWNLLLLDGEKEVSLPYDLPLDPGTIHKLQLQVTTDNPGKKSNVTIIATSLGNQSRNSSVRAEVDFAIEVRGYKVEVNIPERMVVNRTYDGSFQIMLDVKEKIMVAVSTPSQIMVMPLAQVVDVSPRSPGTANFSMLASESGRYPIVFQLVDSNGIPMPEEMTYVDVGVPEGLAVLSGEDLLYSTIASACIMGNGSSADAVITSPPGKLRQKDLEALMHYSSIVILGNESIVSSQAEKELQDAGIKRIQSGSIFEECWLFAAELWRNGTSGVVVAGPKPADIFKAYQVASMTGMPVVICEGDVTAGARAAILDMTERNITLSEAIAVSDIKESYIRALEDAGVSIAAPEEIAKESAQEALPGQVEGAYQAKSESNAALVGIDGNSTLQRSEGGMEQ